MKKILFTFTLVAVIGSARAGWLDALGLGKTSTNATPAASAGLAALSQSQMAGGLI